MQLFFTSVILKWTDIDPCCINFQCIHFNCFVKFDRKKLSIDILVLWWNHWSGLCRLKVINVLKIYILKFAFFKIWHEIQWILCMKPAGFNEIWNLLDFRTMKSARFHEIHTKYMKSDGFHVISKITPLNPADFTWNPGICQKSQGPMVLFLILKECFYIMEFKTSIPYFGLDYLD